MTAGTDCRQAYILHGGNKSCVFGCVGFGHCAMVCPFGAIKIGENHLPIINEKKCNGCGICVKECPKKTLRLIPRTKLVHLACVSRDKGSAVKDICTVGCFACNICVKVCPYNALKMENNLPMMDLLSVQTVVFVFISVPLIHLLTELKQDLML